MITELQTRKARENWIKASKELEFKIISPYYILVDGRKQEVFAFLPEYGSVNGTLVFLMCPSDFKSSYLSKWARRNKIFYSYLNVDELLEYDQRTFREALKDWRKFRTIEELD